MHVVVVGAGLAGLSAAETLLGVGTGGVSAGAGVDVTLIDAGHRPGGRTRTVRDRFTGGLVAESGAEWVDSVHWRVRELMARYGVRDEGEPVPWTTVRRWLFWDGRLESGHDLDRLEPDLFDAVERYEEATDAPSANLLDPSRPDLHPDAASLDARSLADVIDGFGRDRALGPAARLLVTRNSQGEFASEPRHVSCLFVAQQRAYERIEAQRQEIAITANRVAGGTSQLAEGLARDLTARSGRRFRLMLGHRLRWIEQDVDRVTLGVGDEIITADHMILACSLVPLRQVEFRSPMPAPLADAVASLGYGAITKTAVQFDRRTWAAGYGTTDTVSQRIYDCTVDQVAVGRDPDSGILMAYCGGDGGARLATLDEDERVATITADMRRVHGIDAGVNVLGSFSRAWSSHQNYGGAYAVYEPGQVMRHWQVLREPWGRVHLAGEHVATCTGYMEGAIESGRDVAARIIG